MAKEWVWLPNAKAWAITSGELMITVYENRGWRCRVTWLDKDIGPVKLLAEATEDDCRQRALLYATAEIQKIKREVESLSFLLACPTTAEAGTDAPR